MNGFILDTDTWIEYFHRRGGVERHIAVTARHFDLTVVTHNIKHFGKMPGVKCVDWVEK